MQCCFRSRFFLAASLLLCVTPNVDAQLPSFIPTEESKHGAQVSYLGQLASENKIVLDANNGFFDAGFRAAGLHAAPEHEKQLIAAHFTHLVAPTATSDTTARWHLWINQPGDVIATLTMHVPVAEAGAKWKLRCGDQEHTFVAAATDDQQPRAVSFPFKIEASGKHTVQLSRISNQPTPNTQIQSIRLTGSAIDHSSILRARWRPAAIHTQYFASTCPETQMWVFESQNLSHVSSYSPMTTRFGYFGASFNAAGMAAGGVNFSMWAASRKSESAPPLQSMPHLLATGHPQAEFGGFGHEGSGVKIRNWEPFAHHPKSVIQALRVESENGIDTYSGYLFDDRTNHWVLYAVGRRPQKTNTAAHTVLRPASFCEIPGPPATQRSGDQQRTIRRRGWFYGDDKLWHVVDRQTSSTKKNAGPTNKFIAVDDDWFVMGTGGMEMIQATKEVRRRTSATVRPVYMQPKLTAELFQLPVQIGDSLAIATNASAKVTYQIPNAGANAEAVLHYGPVDCLTFVKRTLHGTEQQGVSREMLSAKRTWESSTKPVRISNGQNKFHLTDLEPNRQYYYRLLVTNEAGKCWAFQSGTFRTP